MAGVSPASILRALFELYDRRRGAISRVGVGVTTAPSLNNGELST